MSELKPCPFCGGEARIDTEYDMDGFGNFHKIECKSCGASSKAHFATQGNECPQYYAEVRDEWQKRAVNTALTEHNRLLQLENEQLAKDKAELVEALQESQQVMNTFGFIHGNATYSAKEKDKRAQRLMNVHMDNIFIKNSELLEKHKCD